MSKRRALLIFLGLVLLYPVSYLVVSSKGEFRSKSVHYWDDTGEGVTVTRQWHPIPNPSGLPPQVQGGTLRFYRPLIHLDRRFWHQDRTEKFRINTTPYRSHQFDIPSDPEPLSPVHPLPDGTPMETFEA